MEILGTNVAGFRDSLKRRYPGISPGYYRDLDGQGVSPRLGPQRSPRIAAYERRYMAEPRYIVTNPSSSSSRVVAMIPFQEKASVDSPERTDVVDMPELMQGDINEGERCVDLNDTDEGGEVDIETYEEDHRDHRKPSLWLDSKDGLLMWPGVAELV
ncbi:hypothetical protein KIN20_033485 [Parelaphostrongylus tenuis]|uniref:Uncharacterized protein n=1 Tax=Parelaphostrongylus tenuis TaxID=148309 RepID=A0AAD5R8R6_PARTN|nr:hypothetical protein KIN20_033485 [Parelaphostrongylus tenuis]